MLVILEKVLPPPDVADFRERLEAAKWVDGALTGGSLGSAVKRNQQVEDGSEAAVSLGNRVLRRLGEMPAFMAAALPHRIHPPRFNRYAGGGTYGTHVDGAVMFVPATGVTMRSDISATLFLAGPHEYDGGELEIETAFGAQSVKLAAGDMVLYPSSSLHRVTPVTRGERLACFFWIQSMVPDLVERANLYDLDQAIQAYGATVPPTDATLVKLSGVYHNLLRRWAKI